jgi:threonylcarbamoyladenosine tRNA methylthiotransferase MtaB
MSVEAITLGCRLNYAESETIKELAPAGEDWLVVNSCAVTSEAVRQTRQAIRRAHRQRPDARILVTGCAAELEPEAFAGMAGVARVVRNADKLSPFPLVLSGGRQAVVEGRSTLAAGMRPSTSLRTGAGVPDLVPAGGHARFRSFVAVQTGCDHSCTFCSIWQARGTSRSFAFEAVRDAVAREIDIGAQEIVLTGVDITH